MRIIKGRVLDSASPTSWSSFLSIRNGFVAMTSHEKSVTQRNKQASDPLLFADSASLIKHQNSYILQLDVNDVF